MTGIEIAARPLRGLPTDHDAVLERIGDATVVAIGEATHGTQEFYDTRAAITRRLIEEKGFAAVIAEADWPDAYRVNRWVRHESTDGSADQALSDFERFPTWMWRNTSVLRFIAWLRAQNEGRSVRERVGFYGMDLYSLYQSVHEVIAYLDQVDPGAARRARARYSCFGYFGGEAQIYGSAAGLGLAPSCQQAALAQLVELRENRERQVRADGHAQVDEAFFAEQNARLVKNAEAYYRHMFSGDVSTWNLRDTHMAETIEALRSHLARHGRGDKICVWAHNSHLGDARATEHAVIGQVDVGQLLRERHGHDCVLIGFTTHAGTVTAASRWDGPAERKTVRPSLEGSWERALHDVGDPSFCVITSEAQEALSAWRLSRAIGVLYLPESERRSHYFHATLGQQFDVVIHIDESRALEPLEIWPPPDHPEPPDTYPFAV